MNTILAAIHQDPRLAAFIVACVLTLSNVVTFACGDNDLMRAGGNRALRVSVFLTVVAWVIVWRLYR